MAIYTKQIDGSLKKVSFDQGVEIEIAGMGEVVTSVEKSQNKIQITKGNIAKDSIPTKDSTNSIMSGGVYSELEKKVTVEEGKGLSTNDYTNEEKEKLAALNLSNLQERIQLYEFPTPNESYLGQIRQYIGESIEGGYKKGFFYICSLIENEYLWVKMDMNDMISGHASDISFNNSNSPIKSTNVQDAITEIQNSISELDVEIDETITENSSNPVKSSAIYSALLNKVTVEEGKSLSTNDYTDEEKTIVANAQERMQYTVIPTPVSSFAGKIIQYVGSSNENYSQGAFYTCSQVGEKWQWLKIDLIGSINASEVIFNNTGSGIVSTNLDGAIKEVFNQAQETTFTVDHTIDQDSNNPVSGGAVYEALQGKVTKEEGKGLSTNDYTTEEKNKLANLNSLMSFKGRVDTNLDLPSSASLGDWYLVGLENSKNFNKQLKTKDGWLDIGNTDIDIEGYISIDPVSQNWVLGGKDSGISAKGVTPKVEESTENTDISVYKLDIYDGKGNMYTTPNLKGQDNVFVPMNGFFSIGIDNGTVFLACEEGSTPPPLSLENGCLYYTVGGTIQYVEKIEGWTGSTELEGGK